MNFNRKLDSVHNHSLVASLSLPGIFYAGRLGTERKLSPDCQQTYIFWIGQTRIRRPVVPP